MIRKILVLCLSILVVLFTFILVILYVPKLGNETNYSVTTFLPILIAFSLPFILPHKNLDTKSNIKPARMDLQFI